MELFLNLCWLALMLPAYLVWRQRHPSDQSAGRSLVIVGALGCALMLLFPVISVSDDLHATAQAIEESKNSFRHGAPRACSVQSAAHTSPVVTASSACIQAGFEQFGTVQPIAVHALTTLLVSDSAGRSPPLAL